VNGTDSPMMFEVAVLENAIALGLLEPRKVSGRRRLGLVRGKGLNSDPHLHFAGQIDTGNGQAPLMPPSPGSLRKLSRSTTSSLPRTTDSVSVYKPSAGFCPSGRVISEDQARSFIITAASS
jgi:hypothetical protein